jgi:hypothetical protein
MPRTLPSEFTADELDAMRDWLDDACRQSLADEGFTVDDLDDEDVLIGINTHHIDGIRGFLNLFHDED